ncbi:MAG: T9SS type A sorting domain-containing protein, partial [candidate division WOR-3 bacterium]
PQTTAGSGAYRVMTVRDYTGAREYILGYNECCEEDEWGDCVEWPMLDLVAGTPGYTLEDAYPYRTGQSNFNGTAGVRTTWSISGVMDIVEEIEMTGTAFENSRIRYTVIITNRSGSQRQFGIRGFFDINVAGNDGAYFWDPVNGWRQDEEAWNKPIPFKYYVVSEVYGGGIRYIYGNVSDSSYGMTPTPPDRLSYAYWGDYAEPFGNGLWCNAWLDCSQQNRNVGGTDASVAYWWGYDGTPIILDPNQSFTGTTYFFASPQPLAIEDENAQPGPVFGVRLRSSVVTEELAVVYILTRDAEAKIGVYDLSGRQVIGLEKSLKRGQGELRMPIPDLPEGLYYMRFEADCDARTIRFVKQ